mmetsp:Transcript_38469/g.75851  ORF Transcript_38469/g.75851 Transcript_38469/m.75851 type:complete len:1156 (+) Transcript_38469:82-3549(+)
MDRSSHRFILDTRARKAVLLALVFLPAPATRAFSSHGSTLSRGSRDALIRVPDVRLHSDVGWSDDRPPRPGSQKMKLVGECLESRTYAYEARLKSPLGIKLAEEPLSRASNADTEAQRSSPRTCVVVCEVLPGASAHDAGVRTGDRIVATGASWGGGMWDSSTVEGVTSSVATRLRMYGEVKIRFERPFDGAEEVSWRSVVSETFTVDLRKPLGITLEERILSPEGSVSGSAQDGVPQQKAVFVKGLDPNGNAVASGRVNLDDRILSVSASFGDSMWEAHTVDGVVSAVATRVALNQPVRLKLERKVQVGAWQADDDDGDGDGGEGSDLKGGEKGAKLRRGGRARRDSEEDEQQTGFNSDAVLSGAGGGENDAANAEESAVVVPTSSSSTTATNGMSTGSGSPRDGLVDNRPAPPPLEGIGSAVLALEELKRMDVSTTSTKAVLMERCCYLVYKFGKPGRSASESASKVLQVASTVFAIDGLVPSSKFVNMAMTALAKCRRPGKAVGVYDDALAKGFVPTLEVVTTLARALTPTPAEASKLAKLPLPKVDQKQAGTKGKASMALPWGRAPAKAAAKSVKVGDGRLEAERAQQERRTDRLVAATTLLEKRRVVPDTFFLNSLLRCFMLNGQVSEAEDIFYRVMKAGGASATEEKARPAPPDRFSWNIMIDGYARRGRPDLAAKCFQDMSQMPVVSTTGGGGFTEDMLQAPTALRPDLFTCTALLKAFVSVEDFARADELLSTMEAALQPRRNDFSRKSGNDGRQPTPEEEADADVGTAAAAEGSGFFSSVSAVAPDLLVYNTLLKGYCRSVRWREALDVVFRMEEVAGLSPDYDSFAHLVPALCRAGHPDIGLSKLEDVKRLGIRLDTKLYTMFVVCLARLKDPLGALELLRAMKASGVKPNLKTFTAVMDACLRAEDADLCLSISAELKRAGAEPDEVVYTMIVRAYGLKKEVRKAALLVAALQREAEDEATSQKGVPAAVRPGVALYNALLREAVLCESWGIALGTVEEVLLNGRPNDATYEALSLEPRQSENQVIDEKRGPASSLALRSQFLFDAVDRIKNTPKERIRIAGHLYTTCLLEALKASTGAIGPADAAVHDAAAEALITARRRGEVKLRLRDEDACMEAERTWETKLGRMIEGGEWEPLVLFEESA